MTNGLLEIVEVFQARLANGLLHLSHPEPLVILASEVEDSRHGRQENDLDGIKSDALGKQDLVWQLLNKSPSERVHQEVLSVFLLLVAKELVASQYGPVLLETL